ncbi:oligopeptide transport system permease protein oppC, partial [Vibrio parahaemolyticus V-223/04]
YVVRHSAYVVKSSSKRRTFVV